MTYMIKLFWFEFKKACYSCHQMRRRELTLCVFLVFGTLQAAEAGRGPDLSYLLNVDPNKVTNQELLEHAHNVEEAYQKFHASYGIAFQGIWGPKEEMDSPKPQYYGDGGDAAIFTGHYLVASVYRYLVTREERDLDKVLQTLRGIHILTHVSGTPGVLARCAFPVAEKEKWRFPEIWKERIRKKHVYRSPKGIPDILDPSQTYPEMLFYTRTSKDQFTGVVFGLSAVFALLTLDEVAGESSAIRDKVTLARSIVKKVTHAFYRRLKKTGFQIEDHRGRRGINATFVSDTLRLQFMSLYRAVVRSGPSPARIKRIDQRYAEEFEKATWWNGGTSREAFNFLRNSGSYYPFNLKVARAFSIFLLDPERKHQKKMLEYVKENTWKWTSRHMNAHFTFIYNAMKERRPQRLKAAIYGLKSLSLRPQRNWHSPLVGQNKYPPKLSLLFGSQGEKYVLPPHLRRPTLYFIWQKDPWDTGKKKNYSGNGRSTGIDFLLPYWMGRYYGFISAS